MSRFYITTPIYYVNDVPHLGTAYTTIVADALARYHRLRGHDTRFLTGTDEHGLKIERRAMEEGVAPAAFVDEMSAKFKTVFPKLGCEFDDFIRTTEPRHIEAVQDLWRKCAQNDAIYEGAYEGLYCVGCEAYYTEKELEPAPSGDGFICPTHKTAAERLREPSYFFRLASYQERLLKFYEQHPQFISPESRRNEVISFVRGGLQDLSISRTSFSWGVPVPADIHVPSQTGNPKKLKHVMYVWFDALTNYLSALGPDNDPLRRYWPPDVHLMGKDILRFHAVYWPAFLMAAGFSDDALPRKVFAHGFLTINGQRMSKSLRNVVEPAKLAEVFGADVVRFYLLREVALGQDADFSHLQLIARYNAELADSLGNLLNRTLGLCSKLRAVETLNDATCRLEGVAARGPLEAKLEELAKATLAGFTMSFDDLAPHRAIDALWALCRAANKYIDEAAPWSEAKKENNRARVDTILATALEVIRWVATMLWPVMPDSSGRILAQLGLSAVAPTPPGLVGDDLLKLTWAASWDARRLAVGTPVFPKIDIDRQAEAFAALGLDAAALTGVGKPQSDLAPKAVGKKPAGGDLSTPAAEITFEEFMRVDLRVGTVVAAERVPKSSKLLRVQVDLGETTPRQVVAGIGKTWAPEDLIGKQVTVVANLKPAKLMGLESRGMILAASSGGENGETDLALIAPNAPRANGVRVK